MKAENKEFFLGAVEQLRGLSPDQQPEWGSMSPQHMVEHIVGSWRISNGRARVPVVLSEDQVEERLRFLRSDMPYPRNLQNPTFKKGLPPLRKENLLAAVDQLKDEIEAFFDYHDEHSEAVETHPVFGPLNKEDWLWFQTKHMKHHLAQFGISF